MKEDIVDLMYRSFDEQLNAEEQHRLQRALAISPELQLEFEEIKAMRAVLGDLSVTASETFTDDLMNAIQELEQPGLIVSLRSLFPKVAAACMLLFLCTTVSIYIAEGSLSTDTILGISDLNPEDAYSLLDE